MKAFWRGSKPLCADTPHCQAVEQSPPQSDQLRDSFKENEFSVFDVPITSCTPALDGTGWVSGFLRRSDHNIFSHRRAGNLFSQFQEETVIHNHTKEAFIPKAYFGGILFPYYGHFLLESISRLPNIRSNKIPIVFILLKNTIKEWHTQFFNDIKIRDRIVFTSSNEIIRVGELIRVDQTSSIHCDISRRFLTYTQGIFNFSPTLAQNKIYLSRQLCTNAKTSGEEELEARLSALGFQIINPERFSIREQAFLISTANTVVGIEGSALHTQIFSPNPQNVILLLRRRRIDHNFLLQFAVQPQINFRVISCMKKYAENFSAPSELDIKEAMRCITENIE